MTDPLQILSVIMSITASNTIDNINKICATLEQFCKRLDKIHNVMTARTCFKLLMEIDNMPELFPKNCSHSTTYAYHNLNKIKASCNKSVRKYVTMKSVLFNPNFSEIEQFCLALDLAIDIRTETLVKMNVCLDTLLDH